MPATASTICSLVRDMHQTLRSTDSHLRLRNVERGNLQIGWNVLKFDRNGQFDDRRFRIMRSIDRPFSPVLS